MTNNKALSQEGIKLNLINWPFKQIILYYGVLNSKFLRIKTINKTDTLF